MANGDLYEYIRDYNHTYVMVVVVATHRSKQVLTLGQKPASTKMLILLQVLTPLSPLKLLHQVRPDGHPVLRQRRVQGYDLPPRHADRPAGLEDEV